MTEQLGYLVDQINAMQKAADEQLAKTPNYKKVTDPLVKELTTLKEKLVVLKGDNYVGTAEPQLREKIGTIYGQIAGYFGRPSGAQLANVTVLDDQLKSALAAFEVIKSTRYKAFTDRLLKDKLPEIAIRSFDEYKKSDG